MKIIELKEKKLGLYKEKPHYNTAEFTVAAQHFKEYGTYTNHPFNTSPSSYWYKFWVEEARRCLYGYNIGRDEIPGYFYWYLNYCKIEKAVALNPLEEKPKTILPETSLRYSVESGIQDSDEFNLNIPNEYDYESIQAERITDFPDFWESDYDFFWYAEEAEQLGNHVSVLKSRGRGYSFKTAAMLDRNFYLIPRSKSYAFASEKEYLISDGLLTKAWDMMGHIEVNTPWGKRKSKVDTMLHKRASYLKMSKGVQSELGFGSEIIGCSFKNNPDKAHPYSSLVYTPLGITKWEYIKEGSVLYDTNGGLTNVTEVHEFGERDVYNIIFNDGRIVQASTYHEWEIYRWRNGKNVIRRYSTLDLINELKYKSIVTNKLRIKIPKGVNFPTKLVPIDAYTLGIMLGDGSIKKSNDNQSVLTMKHSDINDIARYIPFEVRNEKWGGDIRNVIFIPNGRKIYKELNLFDKKCEEKFIPDIYKYNTEKVRFDIINGLLDTDGSVTKDFGVIEYSTKSIQLAQDFIWIIHSLGIGGKITTKIINSVIYYRCYVYLHAKDNRLFNLTRKKELLRFKKNNSYAKNKCDYLTIKNVEYSHVEKVKCITVDSVNSMYLIGDFIPTFNSRGKRGKLIIWEEGGKFPNLLPAWNISLKSMSQGRLTFGLMVVLGTGGTDVNDLMGLEQLYTRGDGYKVHMIKNTFEPELGYDKTGLFIGEHRNHEIAMDKDGNSNVPFALKYIEEDRKKHLDKTKNREMHLRYCAEAPIKPSEALMQIGNNIFPVDLLKQQKAYLLSHRETHLDSAWIGILTPNPETGKIEWRPDKDAIPIDHYPHNDLVNINGAIVIWEPPITNRDGIVPPGLYISGNDNYDHDQSTTDSLGSTFVMNRLTERLVAEYTGRPAVAPTFYANNRYLLQHYNAMQNFENNLQGLRSDARKHHQEHLLCDTPTIIEDKIDDKRVLMRGKGTPGTTPIIKYGLELILAWLMREAEPGSGILNLHKIKSIPLIDELIYYNSKGNFDRIYALIYLLILHEDRWQHIPDLDYKPKATLHPFFSENPLFKMNKENGNRIIMPNGSIKFIEH